MSMSAALMVRLCGYEITPPVEVRRGRWCSGVGVVFSPP
ncbi:hypothetical protein I553_10645 [Mycobacterium xenopi 4042]|uniref:Uncharacterized protein n=1 Tax=Mycobacterium xenopi 4042 TaxID=1299334 RepID=X8DXE2_MYCXE|nr:hypothetical protein I553_10645 [Mycobacterium xenopi 4042]